MKKRISQQSEVRRPRSRVIPERPDKGAFFPGEVARMFGIEEIDHQRLRRVFDLVRYQRGEPQLPKGEWARFDYLDLACTLEVIRICVDRRQLSGQQFRLALVHIRRACERLRSRGLDNPLLQARLDLNGTALIATIDGTTFDVQTGQQLIDEAVDTSSRFMDRLHSERASTELLQRIDNEKAVVANQSTGSFIAAFDP